MTFLLNVNAIDSDLDDLTWSITSPPNRGEVAIVAHGTLPEIDYTPNTNFFGNDNFELTVSDDALSDAILINVIVTPENDPPVAEVAPSVTGIHEVGEVLAGSAGVWNDLADGGATPTVTLQWQRATTQDASGQNGNGIVSLSSSPTYTIQEADFHPVHSTFCDCDRFRQSRFSGSHLCHTMGTGR